MDLHLRRKDCRPQRSTRTGWVLEFVLSDRLNQQCQNAGFRMQFTDWGIKMNSAGNDISKGRRTVAAMHLLLEKMPTCPLNWRTGVFPNVEFSDCAKSFSNESPTPAGDFAFPLLDCKRREGKSAWPLRRCYGLFKEAAKDYKRFWPMAARIRQPIPTPIFHLCLEPLWLDKLLTSLADFLVY